MRCVALISGGLDSHLAARLIGDQGVQVEALHFTTPFVNEPDAARSVAQQLGVPLTEVALGDEFLSLVRQPRFGYSRAANPCLDCRILMFRQADAFRQQCGADFVISGEVAGQQVSGQRRRDLEAIAHHSGLRDLLLRPLSAQTLPPTRPEREGWVDRERLRGFFGRGRRDLIQLARQMGITPIPVPSGGCPLGEAPFARKVFDLIGHTPSADAWQFLLLKHGRHFRVDSTCKVIVGRNEADNYELVKLFASRGDRSAMLLVPEGFVGPVALAIGPCDEAAITFAIGLVHRFSKQPLREGGRVRVQQGADVSFREPLPCPVADPARNLAEQ